MERRLELTVPCLPADAGEPARLDAWVASQVDDLSRERAAGLIESGLVTVNGLPARKSRRLAPGDRVVVVVPAPVPVECAAESIALEILHEDEHLLVVVKPRGMLTHPVGRHVRGTLVNALLGHTRDLSGIGGELRPGIVHRLDRDTSGLLVVAKSDRSHRALSAQFKARTVEKVYLAVVAGCPKHPRGSISLPIGRVPGQPRMRRVDPRGGKQARTDYRVVETAGPVALLEVRLHTGRTHQIRVHLSHLGYPLVGDRAYGWKGQRDEFAGVALHSHRLAFSHPADGRRLAFESPMPADLAALLERMRPA